MASIWQTLKSQEGREYYYNPQTKTTQWSKPEELFTSQERAIANLGWTEHDHDGRKYWFHNVSKKTSWDAPIEVKQILDQQPFQQQSVVLANSPQTIVSSSYPHEGRRAGEGFDSRHDRGHQRSHAEGSRAGFVSASGDPEYGTFEEAESAFMKLLKKAGVQSTWTWDRALESIVKDAQYRSIKDPKTRKATFDKYIMEARHHERQQDSERLAKLRDNFRKMLQSHPEITHNTQWKTALSIIERESIFRSTKNDSERRHLFDDYIAELKKAHEEANAERRNQAGDKLTQLLHDLEIGPFTRWYDARLTVESSDRFQNDNVYRSLSPLDVLKRFENHVKNLEQQANHQRQGEKLMKQRRDRKLRDRYIELLSELKLSGKIQHDTKWSSVNAHMKDDERYKAILDYDAKESNRRKHDGEKNLISSALELFWIELEAEEHAFRAKRNAALDILDRQNVEFSQDLSLSDFNKAIKTDSHQTFSEIDIERIHKHLLDRVSKPRDDRKTRDATDSLRDKLKTLDPPLRLSTTWEDVRPQLEHLDAFRMLQEGDRIAAFEKSMRRLRDRDDDEKYLARHHRHRDGRSRPGDRHEPDAYEAERKRAQDNRERQYHRASGGRPTSSSSSGRGYDRALESHRSSGGRLSRDFDSNRDHRDRGGLRELDRPPRDHGYHRADPRDSNRELDYGDGGRAGSMAGFATNSKNRKKKGDESDLDGNGDKRPSKRARLSHTPNTAKSVEKEDEVLKSGSEEGEIEEA